MVTWYRYGDTPRVTLHPHDGESRSLPVRRDAGRLWFDLDGTPAEEVRSLTVDWPAQSLRRLTLIDTPGIASLSGDVSERSTTFLTPEDAPSEADAIVYLMRHLHASDLNFLEAFRDTAAGTSGSVNALAVLSRADEIGGGRVDSLLSAGEVAARYRSDDSLHALALGVVPVAGLLAQSARSLRQSEFDAFEELAALSRETREGMLLSADRFSRPTAGVRSSPADRDALLNRFGLFGIRMACALIRGGVDQPTRLAEELVRRSGLHELLHLLHVQFQSRSDDLRARAALVGVEALLLERPHSGSEGVRKDLERIQAGAHELRELRALALARTSGVALPPEESAAFERLIGGDGVDPRSRAGVPSQAPESDVTAALLVARQRWRTRAESPLTDQATAELCQFAVRSCEAAIAAVAPDSGRRTTARLVLAAEPGAGARQGADDERRTG